ncbi:MAG: protein-tyrosine phosphatase family protein [archaeon]|nr:protein-tyrosine phosphatase family protein [archaeon]
MEGEERPLALVDAEGRLVEFYDAKHPQSPLVLSSIPTSSDHLSALRERHGQMRLALYTLNLRFERDLVGLDALAGEQMLLRMHLFPTIDFYTPSLVDTVRAVDLLRKRQADEVAVVHCKAGRGRSAAVVAAYILAELLEAGTPVAVEEVEAYIRTKRPAVKLGRQKRAALREFVASIQREGGFQQLRDSMAQQIEAREEEIVNSQL